MKRYTEKGNNLTFIVHILMGLPGSGKSTYAHKNYPQRMYCHDGKIRVDLDHINVTDFDNLQNKIYEVCNETDIKTFCEGYTPNDSNIVDICVDGLITTKAGLLRVASYIVSYINKKYNSDYYLGDPCKININIHQWNEDRENCLHNDRMRKAYGKRDTLAQTTIRHMPYEILNSTDISEMYGQLPGVDNIKLTPHTVRKANVFDVVFEPLIMTDMRGYYGGHCTDYGDKPKKTQYMYSDSWSGGGTWANCWGGEGTISSESPKEFNKFDNLLEKVVPNISFLQYKKIRNACVDTIETHEYDYYGGCEIHNHWRCDLAKLYDMLKEMNIITDYGAN